MKLLLLLFYSLFYQFITVSTQYRSQNILYSTPANCTQNQYYNKFEFRCESCPNSTIPSIDHSECQCPPGKKLVSKQLMISICDDCPEGTFASPDQTECLKCMNGTCQCSNRNILIFRDPSGSPLADGAYCSSCASGFLRTSESRCDKCLNDCACENCSSVDQVYTRIKLQNGVEMRSHYIETTLPIALKRCAEKNLQFCETLMNLCVLQNFETSSINACGTLENIKRAFNPWQNSWDPISFADDSELDKDNVIDHQYHFDRNSFLELIFARYDANGSFDGFHNADQIRIHFCGFDINPSSAFLFGKRYHKQCQIPKNSFSDPNINQKFFEMFLKFTDDTGRVKMYPLFVLNSAIRVNNQLNNLFNKEKNRWVLTRRFFLFDDYTMMFDNSSKLFRFASKIGLHIGLQKAHDGYIMPPFLTLEYDDSSDEILDGSFEIFYHKDPSDYDQKLVILLSVLIPLSLFCAAICAYSWGRRMGKPSAVDASSIIYFFVCEVSILGDVFFIMFSIIACWLTFAYKSQTYVFYNMLSNDQERSLFHYIIAALVLKFSGLIFTMISLVFQETFFIDWERQKLKQNDEITQTPTRDLTKSTETEPVVVWRTYLIANEWNELQQYRKTSLSFQLIVLIVLHEYFQFKNYALVEPNFERYPLDPTTSQPTLLSQLAVVTFMYMFLAMIQWLVQVIVIERIVIDPFHNFVDLCSVSNISVLSLTHSLFGYYVHGRSVHGKGDAGMSEMNAFLQRERDNLCGYRGLEPSSELQTFTVNLPALFRLKYDEISLVSRQKTTGVVGNDAYTMKMDATIEAHSKMNEFLKKFIDHSIPDIDYIVRDRPLLEAILDAEMSDSSITGTLTRDPSEISYSRCFIYGNEWAWLSFECLTVVVFYIWSDSIHFACFIVYSISKIMRIIFGYLSTNHLVKTSLIDHRFLV